MEKRPKCKICKSHFVPAYRGKVVCSNQDCWNAWILSQKLNQWKKVKPKKKEELKTVRDWMNEAQAMFNKYIRLRDKGRPCVSCLKPYQDNFQAGHFYSSGGHKVITFNELNVFSQCVQCNMHLSGNLNEYRKNITKRITPYQLEVLDSLAHETKKYTVDELRNLIELYKEKIKNFHYL